MINWVWRVLDYVSYLFTIMASIFSCWKWFCLQRGAAAGRGRMGRGKLQLYACSLFLLQFLQFLTKQNVTWTWQVDLLLDDQFAIGERLYAHYYFLKKFYDFFWLLF